MPASDPDLDPPPDAARAALLAQRARLRRTLADLSASFADSVAAARDSNLDDEHDPEGSTIAAERSLVSSLARDTEQRLIAIERALDRLRDGSYARCETCGAAISATRLQARPSATQCIACAARTP